MRRPEISVALATYNGARFLSEQLNSLAKQTLLPTELVITDDGSTDETVRIASEFGRRAPFQVRVSTNPRRLKFAANFLMAASLCKGEFIAFCDQDDVWMANKLERCAEALSDKSVVLAVHAGLAVDELRLPLRWRFPDIARDVVRSRLRSNPRQGVPGFSMVFRSDLPMLFTAMRPWGGIDRSSPMFHDQWVSFLANVFGRVAYIREPLVLYRRHGRNVTDPSPLKRMETVRRALRTESEAYKSSAELMSEWATFLENSVAALPIDPRVRCLQAAKYYQSIAQGFSMRSGLYERPSELPSRMAIWFNLIAQGTYRSKLRGGFGLTALCKDLVVAAGARQLR